MVRLMVGLMAYSEKGRHCSPRAFILQAKFLKLAGLPVITMNANSFYVV